MSDDAFPHFHKEGGAREGLRLRYLAFKRKRIQDIFADQRKLAAQNYRWARHYGRVLGIPRDRWVTAVESQFSQIGIYLRNTWNDQFLYQICSRPPFPRVQILGEKVFLNECPLCRKTSVELMPLSNGDPVIPHSRFRWLFFGSIDPILCTHRVPVDEESWKIIQNALYLHMQVK